MSKYESTPDPVQLARERAEHLYRSGQYLCSEAVLLVVNEYLGHPMPDDIIRLASGWLAAYAAPYPVALWRSV